MMKYFTALLCCGIIFLNSPGISQAGQAEKILGIWQGVLSVTGTDLHLIFEIKQDEEGKLTAVMDVPEQGAKGLAMDTVVFENNRLIMEIKIAAASYEGMLQLEGGQINGHWKQGGMSFPLNLDKSVAKFEAPRPQHPIKPFPYDEIEVEYRNIKQDIKLAGTLTLPRVEKRVPAVLLITGSGAQDRDETVFGHKPFLVISDYLTRKNIATLRVDDRGVGGSGGNLARSTTADLSLDVLAGIEFLKQHPKIDPKKIILAGHSEGGIIAPLAASQSSDVAGIIMLAGTGVPGHEIIAAQVEQIMRAEGYAEEVVQINLELQIKIGEMVVQYEDDPATLEQELRKFFAGLTEEEKKLTNLTETKIEGDIRQLMTPWIRYFFAYDPRPALSRVKCPVLALIGEKDLQVPFKQNLPAIKQALEKGGNQSIRVQSLPGLNHLFQTAETGSVSEYSKIEETISPDVLEIISEWLLVYFGDR